jgi:superfamily II DNA or RNA helicase
MAESKIILNELIELTRLTQYDEIKKRLGENNQTVMNLYLAELYKGNGWCAKIKGGSGQGYVLISQPNKPDKVSLIVRAKTQRAPLTFDQARFELENFEEIAAQKYKCTQFKLIAIGGFEPSTQTLSEWNLGLSGWDYICDMASRYDQTHNINPFFELYPHNQRAYIQVQRLWRKGRYAAVIQATGTGKSYIISQVMTDFPPKKIILAPTKYILEQQKRRSEEVNMNTIFMTYTRCAKLSNEEIANLDVKIIILDEFHRCGAVKWGLGVQRVLNFYPEAQVLGTSATPIRYLDGARDMSDEIFEGKIASEISLPVAVEKRILPPPTYVTALYSLNEEYKKIIKKTENSKNPKKDKNEIISKINQFMINWERTYGIPNILKKYLTKKINKFIIFCIDISHLDEMIDTVTKWFDATGIYKKIQSYRISHKDPESDLNYKEFIGCTDTETAFLLFSVNMVNEGIHSNDVGAVVLLRATVSPNIFYQQIGRCFQINANHTPIIFDFVNNFKNIYSNTYLKDLTEAKEKNTYRRESFGLKTYDIDFRIEDETKDVMEVFDEVSKNLNSWSIGFKYLTTYVQREGHARIPQKHVEGGFNLGFWVSHSRVSYKNKNLSIEKIKQLESVPGWVWDDIDYGWEEGLSYLKNFAEREGHTLVPNNHIEDGFKLGIWLANHKRIKLTAQRVADFESMPGWVWSPQDYKYKLLLEYVEREGHARVPQKHKEGGVRLGLWVCSLRARYKDRLSKNEIEQLESLPGWAWNDFSFKFNEGYKYLLKFVDREKHAQVPDKHVEDGFKLGYWVADRRKNYRQGILPEDRIKQLESLPGWVWDFEDYKYKLLLKYIEREGHAKVPRKHKEEGVSLGFWVGNLRAKYKENRLSKNEIEQLESLPGWAWSLRENSPS